jgi:YggT family protein
LALGAFVAAGLVVSTHAAVRRGWLGAFGWWPRLVRRVSGPLLRPFERRLAAAGQNPQDAPLWLLGAVAVGGVLLLGLVSWIAGTVGLLAGLRSATPLEWARLLVEAAAWLLMTAILVRVVGLWLGFGRYHRLMRHLYRLTDWIIEPVRRRLPPLGMLDLSPLAAYMLIFLLRELLLGLLR